MNWEADLVLWANGLRRPWADPIASGLSDYGLHLLLVVPWLIWLVRRGTARSDGARSLIRDTWLSALSVSFLVEYVIKPLIARPRPTSVPALREALHVLGTLPPVTSVGFPSGTAAAMFGAAFVIAREESRPLRWFVFGVATLTSMSRLYIGVHYPTDVLAGIVAGWAAATFVIRHNR